jgi:hypothetical protein
MGGPVETSTWPGRRRRCNGEEAPPLVAEVPCPGDSVSQVGPAAIEAIGRAATANR